MGQLQEQVQRLQVDQERMERSQVEQVTQAAAEAEQRQREEAEEDARKLATALAFNQSVSRRAEVAREEAHRLQRVLDGIGTEDQQGGDIPTLKCPASSGCRWHVLPPTPTSNDFQ